jgi:hypothetical protein
MAEFEKKMREKLKEQGCSFLRHGKGDHNIWYSPLNWHSFPVDEKIKSRFMVNATMRQAGIDYHF